MTDNAELAEPFRFYLCEFCVCAALIVGFWRVNRKVPAAPMQ